MRAIHWIMAAMILILLGVGLWMTDLPPSDQKWEVYALHKSFGVLAMMFFILRISVRLRSEIPAYPRELKPFDVKLSKATVHIMYMLMFLMPFTGYCMSTFGGHDVKFFGVLLPALFEKNPPVGNFFNGAHTVVAFALIGMIGLHLAGTIKHYIFERINLLNRVW